MMKEKQFNAVMREVLPDLTKYRVLQICEERSQTCEGTFIINRMTGKEIEVKWDPKTVTPDMIREKISEAMKKMEAA